MTAKRSTRRPARERRDIYAEVTAQITQRLEQGTVPWQQPWRSSGLLPTSIATGRPYRGVNLLLLAISAQAAGYASPYWLTFKQALDHGGSVRKGEKGTLVVFWKQWTVDDNDSTEPDATKSVFMLRHYVVFNLEQCDDVTLPKRFDIEREDFEPIEPDEAVSKIIAEYPNAPKIRHAVGDRAFYRPDMDTVTLPALEQFTSPGAYAETVLHELTHSTGHESRLNRFERNGKPQHHGDERYAREELVAEMGAAMLSAIADIELRYDNAAAYIASWLRALTDDPTLIVKAAAQAQKAVDHILGTTFEKEAAA